jgi:glycosyltransferase involved in cell wall biosynthesis
MVLLDAIYVNSGGGKVLLDYLIKKIVNKKLNYFFLLDHRTKGSYSFLNKNVIYLKSSFIKRHMFYIKNQNKFDSVISFGNIPPSIKLNCKVYTYFQNVLFIEKKFYSLKFLLKKIIFNLLTDNTDYFIVQSELVKQKLLKKINNKKAVVFPFFKSNYNTKKNKIDFKKINFIYVSSGEKYKNHINLLKAFEIYNKRFPESLLTLTISDYYTDLLVLIGKMKKNKIKIKNLGHLNHDEIINEYKKADVLVFPSKNESFGLGLLEAAQMNMPVISSDLNYVYQIIKPSATFDPEDYLSIYDCMCNYEEYYEKLSKCIVTNKIDQMLNFISKNKI